MALNFKELTLEDKAFVDEVIKNSDKRFCEYTFGNMYCWGRKYGLKIARTEQGFVIGTPEKARFNFPVGSDFEKITSELVQSYPSITFSVLSQSEAEYMEKNFDGFEITQLQEKFDYIYETEKLQTLSGKKLAAKRNHINAFLADGEYYIENINEENVDKLFEFNRKWCLGLCEKDTSLHEEMCAVNTGLENFSALGYRGLILYKNGKICAYSYGEPINYDTFCVHVEKADYEVRGAYQMINREFAKVFGEGFLYINREDDAGDEGLRRAKMSYYPTELGTKFKAERKK